MNRRPAIPGLDAVRPPRTNRETSRGFSLLEILAVLAVVAVIAAAVAESLVHRMRVASQEAERGSLANLAEVLERHIARTKQVPAGTNLAATLAAELVQPIGTVLTNTGGNPRLFLLDPACVVGTNAGAAPPYTQGTAGSILPVRPRVLLLSSLGDTLPYLGTMSASLFDSLWNLAPGTTPAAWTNMGWSGPDEELFLQRVEFGDLFHHLVLNNLDAVRQAPYAIGPGAAPVTLSPGQITEGWFIDGTELGLYRTTNALQGKVFLTQDASFVYEDGVWRRGVFAGRNSNLGWFGDLVQRFLDAAPPPPDPNHFGATQQSVVDELYIYMWVYGTWATEGFPKGGSSSDQQVPSLRTLEESAARLEAFSYNLIKAP